MKKDTSRGSALINALQSDSAIDIGKEYLEIGIDTLLESGVIKDIPIVNTVVGIFNVAGSVRDQIFTSKLLRFLIQFSEVSRDDRIEMVKKLNEDEKFAGRAGTAVIEIKQPSPHLWRVAARFC